MKGSVLIRVGLAAMWLVHGLEKFGAKWPTWLGGGTHSVASMLKLMAEETPFGFLQGLIQHLMLPWAVIMQYPIGLLEIGIAVMLALGVLLPYAALLGAVMQTFFWLGFFTLDWPLQYPVIIVAHSVLAAPRWLQFLRLPLTAEDRWLQILRLPLAAVWLYQGLQDGPALLRLGCLLLGGLLLGGLGTRLLGIPSLALVVLMFQRENWGAWPWSYYMVATSHAALSIGPPVREATLLRFWSRRSSSKPGAQAASDQQEKTTSQYR
jgi:uncharacterized membrane protein YphA (DoxX/SURF4 family)